MIRLCNVSTERLISFLEYMKMKSPEMMNAYLALTNHQIKDFETLRNMVANGRREFDNDILRSAVKDVETNIEHANSLGREPILFTCDDYKDSDVFRKTLKLTDKRNLCSVLLCKSPVITGSCKYGALKDVRISEAKDLLGRVVAYDKKNTGNNAFIEKIRRFGPNEAENVRRAINFYEQQVLRQAAETRRRGVNLFVLNKEEKEKIVSAQIENIVKYLVENADVCVWGELSNAQKNRLITAVTTYSGYENQMIREKMIDVISNYTTLKELENDIVKEKTLDRFIIK